MKITLIFIASVFVFFSFQTIFGQTDKPRIGRGGVCNGRATYLPKPEYSEEAKRQNAKGTVSVLVKVDEEGNVTSAKYLSGHPLLRKEAEKAALKAKLEPTKLSNVPVKVNCVLVYNFLPERELQTKQTEAETKPYSEPPIISLGIINDKAKVLPMPKMSLVQPQGEGSAKVEVKIDLQKGKVVSAMAFEGHPLLRAPAANVAMKAEFEPILTEFPKIYGKGTLVYKIEDVNGEIIKNENPKPLVPVMKGGIINGMATYLPKPEYTEEAKINCADGTVEVLALIYMADGKLISAKVISGDEFLKEAAQKAALKAEFSSPNIDGNKDVYIKGTLVYNFDAFSKCINLGIVNKKALNIPKPSISQFDHPRHVKLDEEEIVVVKIVIDVNSGRVIHAKAIIGQPLLRGVSEMSARRAKFPHTFITGSPVKVKALLAYKFKPDRTTETDIEEDDKDVVGIPIELVKPTPPFCNCRFGGDSTVIVEAEIDERGNVVEAKAISGFLLLKIISEKAALKSTFLPTNIKAKIKIAYKFKSINEDREVEVADVYVKEVIIKKTPVIEHPPPNTEPIFAPQPEYPEVARAFNISGKVVVEILVDEDGNVEEAKISSGHPMLRNAALKAAGQTKFEPILLSGKPVKVRSTIVYYFKP